MSDKGDSSAMPEWARQRACDLANAEERRYGRMNDPWQPSAYGFHTLDALARYIAEHEQPPVDPLLIEAREMVGRVNQLCRARILAGELDTSVEVQFALAGLRRGIEIGSKS